MTITHPLSIYFFLQSRAALPNPAQHVWMHSIHHSALFVSSVLDVDRVKADICVLRCHVRHWPRFSYVPEDFQTLRFD
jgi:hypothetical protein